MVDFGFDDPIPDVKPVFPGGHDLVAPEPAEMLGTNRLLEFAGVADLSDGELGPFEGLDDLEALGVTEELDDVRGPLEHRGVNAPNQASS